MNMTPRNMAIGIALLFVIVGVAVYGFSRTPHAPPAITPSSEGGMDSLAVPSETPIATTSSATSIAPEPQSTTAALNQRIYDSGVYITPLEVVGDSRCPMGVYCIQAGTVTLKAKLEDATHSEIVTFTMGSPLAFGGKHVTLMSVTPPKSQHGTITPTDYRFTFSVAAGMGGEGA